MAALLAVSVAGCAGCSSEQDVQDVPQPPGRSEVPASPELGVASQHVVEGAAAIAASEPAPSERVLVMVDGPAGARRERWMSAGEATAAGYTVVDFSDDWTPFLFKEQHDAAGRPLPNRYRRVFIGLANDELDGDGEPLPPNSKNYLEVYGIFPSLSVIRERFLLDETRTCSEAEDVAALQAVKSVNSVAPAQMQRNAARQSKLAEELERARVKARVGTLAELALGVPALASKVREYERWGASQKALAAAERRLTCEGFLPAPGSPAAQQARPKHVLGTHDEALRLALQTFQKKHMIYDGPSLRPRTLEVLARTTLENDHAALLRAFRERVVAAADVIEDGSTQGKNGAPTFRSASGEVLPIRNLADELTEAASKELGLDTPESALAFFKRHGAPELADLRVAVKLGPRPEYYAPHMDLSIVVDRGDVWYDPPFDDKDKWHVQVRERYPSLTLFLDYQGQKIALARWRTTIGGWRSEQATNGYEYYRYKGSDTGPRVLRKVVSGPVWIAPESTPIRGLVKGKKIEGRWQGAVNYDELGPGYLSAYGVVAGYFVIPGEGDRPDVDRGIRAHGSSDYLSIYSNNGYSHGCHRLPNHLAIRLYDFVLKHRNMRVLGDAPMAFSRQFLSSDQVYDMRIPSRGFEFELDPPMPVNVLEGTIRGEAKEPVEGAIPKPGMRYPPPPPDEDAVDAVTTASGRVLMKDSAASKGEP
jgi:hypothetical protein